MSTVDCIFLFFGFCLLLSPMVLTVGGVLCVSKGVMALRARRPRVRYLLLGPLMILVGLVLACLLLRYLPMSIDNSLQMME
jgi:hypothetical protein